MRVSRRRSAPTHVGLRVTPRDPALSCHKRPSLAGDVQTFEKHRPELLALAYRMLGDMGRAEDAVQEAWLRWQGREEEVDAPRAYLAKVVTRLCLNELDSARARREESRSDRLPEPVHLGEGGIGGVEALDQISMAFLVVLQRLTPAERAVLLLHDVFDFSHAEIAELVKKSVGACRQLLRRAREGVASERRLLAAPREEHRRILQAFLKASSAGDVTQLVDLLADDAVLVTDGGQGAVRYGRARNLPRPLSGRAKIAAFLAAVGRQAPSDVRQIECELNGQPALVTLRDGRAIAAVLLSVADGKVHRIFIQADSARLRHVCGLS
jgi:RNA polymerase sigma-70 factor, ECF subfamily